MKAFEMVVFDVANALRGDRFWAGSVNVLDAFLRGDRSEGAVVTVLRAVVDRNPVQTWRMVEDVEQAILMTEDGLAAIEAREQKASRRGWRVGNVEKHKIYIPHPEGIGGLAGERVVCLMNEHFAFKDDAQFIAQSRQDIPRMAREIRRLREALGRSAAR